MEFALSLMPSAAGAQVDPRVGAVAPSTQHQFHVSAFRVTPALGGVGPESVTLRAAATPAGAVGISFAGSGLDAHTVTVSGLFEGVVTNMSLTVPVDAPGNFLDWSVSVVATDPGSGAAVADPLVLTGSTSRFRVVAEGDEGVSTSVDLGELAAGRAPDAPVFVVNLTDAPLALTLTHTSSIVSVGRFRPSCNRTQPNVSRVDLAAHETVECRLTPRDTLTDADLGAHAAALTVSSSTAADLTNADTQVVPLRHEVHHDLSQEGAIYAHRLAARELLLAQRLRMGPASIFYDHTEARMRFQVGQRDVDFTVDSTDTVRSRVRDLPETYLRVVEDTTSALGGRALEIVNESTPGLVETLVRVGADGQIRLKSGVLVAQNPAIPNVHEFSLNVAPKTDGSSALEVRDVHGSVNFDIQENSHF